jgi:hypothetical protein
MAGTSTRPRVTSPYGEGRNWPDVALRAGWITATILAFLVGVFVVPVQFVDGHRAGIANEIERSGAEAYPVLEVRQKVDRGRRGIHTVEMQVATYRSGTGTATVRLHGYDSSEIVESEEGWFVAAGPDDRLEVYVTEDGRNGFLSDDYRPALEGEYDDLYLVADLWIAGWAVVGVGALTASSLRRARRREITARRAALAPAVYCAVAAASVGVAYVVSFPLAGLN